jgi:uncharacterized protein YkwD
MKNQASNSRRRNRIRLAAVAVAAAMFTTLAPAVAFAGGSSVAPTIEQCLLDLHNEERVARGSAPLTSDSSLVGYAREWSFEMEASGFRHSDLSFPGSWRRQGENISWTQGYGTDCSVHHEMFMNSPGHKANILNAYYDRVGIGIVHDPSQGSIVHVTVVFADSDGEKSTSPTPADAPPAPPWSESPCQTFACDGFASIDNGGHWRVNELDEGADPLDFYFGNPGDMPFMGDWDGDGEATPGLFRQSDGFVYVKNGNSQGTADLEFYFGNPGDVPLIGDFDGDGRDSVSIWRPSQAQVFIINGLGEDGRGLGAADFAFSFGNPNDTPFVGDFNGDGIDTIGLYRQSTGFVYFTNTLGSGNADLAFFYGDPGDQILAGDWDGDGDDTVGVYRPSSGKVYLNLENTNGPADWQGYIGQFPSVVTAGNTP